MKPLDNWSGECDGEKEADVSDQGGIRNWEGLGFGTRLKREGGENLLLAGGV